MLTERFVKAVALAVEAHAGQVRKHTDIPYASHVLAVASLVLEQGGDEDQAIAGLLHDVLEDCGPAYAAPIRQQFLLAQVDALGQELAALGITVEDSPQGARWKK